MFQASTRSRFPRWASIFLLGMLTVGLCTVPFSFAGTGSEDNPVVLKTDDIKKMQEALRDKGYDPGPIDGHMGPKSRAAVRKYQKSENLPVTGYVDAETAGKLGVGPESIEGNFKGAGKEVKEGSKEASEEIKEGKPVAAGKEFGKGVGRAGKKIGKGVKKAVDPESDRGEREEKEKEPEEKE